MNRKPGCRLGCRSGCRSGPHFTGSSSQQLGFGALVLFFKRSVLQLLWSLLCNLIDMSVLWRGSMGDWLAASRTRGDSKWIWTSRFLSTSQVFQVLLFCNSWNSLFSPSQPQFFGLQTYVMFFWCLVQCLRTEPLRLFPLLGTFFFVTFFCKKFSTTLFSLAEWICVYTAISWSFRNLVYYLSFLSCTICWWQDSTLLDLLYIFPAHIKA